MATGQKASLPWLKGNTAASLSPGVPQAEIDGVSNDELGQVDRSKTLEVFSVEACVVPASSETKSECALLTNAQRSLPPCPPSLTPPTTLISVSLWKKKISSGLKFPCPQEVLKTIRTYSRTPENFMNKGDLNFYDSVKYRHPIHHPTQSYRARRWPNSTGTVWTVFTGVCVGWSEGGGF